MRNILLFSFLLLGGCLSLSSRELQLKDLQPQVFRFEDIPVPKGFKFFIKDSVITEAGKIRAGTLIFKGKALPSEVTKFYKDNMPQYNWQLLNIIEGKQSLMNFKKKDEICTIRFEWQRTSGLLSISISPYFEQSLGEK